MSIIEQPTTMLTHLGKHLIRYLHKKMQEIGVSTIYSLSRYHRLTKLKKNTISKEYKKVTLQKILAMKYQVMSRYILITTITHKINKLM